MHVPVVTLKTENNKKLSELLRKSFSRSVFWNEYKSEIQTVITENAAENSNMRRILLDSSFQGVNRLFVMCFNNVNTKRNNAETESHRRYYLPRVEIKDRNLLIDVRAFYDQNITDNIIKYNELVNLTTGKSKDCTTGCLIDYDFYVNEWKVVAVDISKQSVLDSDPRSIQQVEFTYRLRNNLNVSMFTV